MEEEYQDLTEQPVAPEITKPKKGPLIPILLVITGILIVLFFYGLLSNTYKTPLNLQMNVLNAKSFNRFEKGLLNLFNGFCEKEVKGMYKILIKSDDFDRDDMEDSFEDLVDQFKDKYGDNYKFSYEITDKEKLDKDELKDIKDAIKELAENLEENIEEIDDMDSDDWEDLKDESGLSKSDLKKMVAYAKKIQKKMKNPKVTAGYVLEVIYKVTGSELDEPEEFEATVTVCKVNGKWITVGLSDLPLL